LVERVEQLRLRLAELEVEHRSVRTDAVRAAGLGDDDSLALDRPAEHDLGGSATEPLGDTHDRRVPEAAATLERAIGLEDDSVLLAVLEQLTSVVEGAEVHLVDGRGREAGPSQCLQLVTAVVA